MSELKDQTMTATRSLAVTVCVIAAVIVASCSTDPEFAKREYVKSGDRFVEQKKYSEATVQYRNALQQDPLFGEARFKLAQAYEQLGDRPNAVREYIRAADALPNDVRAQVMAGGVLLLVQRFEEARGRAEKALKLDPKSVEAQVVLGSALAGLRDFDSALSEFEEAVKLSPNEWALQQGIGSMQAALGRNADAEAAFRKAVDLAPKDPRAQLALASFFWSNRRFAEAEQRLKNVLSLDARNVRAHRALAVLYGATRRAPLAEPHLKALADQDKSPGHRASLVLADYYVLHNRHDDAMKVLGGIATDKSSQSAAQTRIAALRYRDAGKAEGNRAIDEVLARDPKNVAALLLKARFQVAENKLDDALTTTQKAVAADERSVPARYLLATLWRAKNRPDEAIAAFNEVLKINPRAAGAQVQLAELSLARGDTARASQLANDAARLLPNDARARLAQVHALASSGQVAQAQQLVGAILKHLPAVSEVHYAAGVVAVARNDVAAARKAFVKAQELAPGDIDVVSALVRLDFQERRPDAAKARVEQQLARRPNSTAAMVLAARVYATAGDGARSEELLRKVIAKEPENLQAYGMLAQLYVSERRLSDARTNFERVLKDQPGSTSLATIVAIIYKMEGKREEAKRRYEQIVTANPQAAVAANNLAYMYVEDGGNLDLALQLAQAAKQKLPDEPEITDTLGWIYVKKGLVAQGVRYLEESVANNPKNATRQYHLGVALVKAGDEARGRQTLERALALNLDPKLAEEARGVLAQITPSKAS
jgi:tetratricopeptide (TPR) repeat protein